MYLLTAFSRIINGIKLIKYLMYKAVSGQHEMLSCEQKKIFKSPQSIFLSKQNLAENFTE